MADLPGHIGMPLFGDCSTEFYKDMMHFINKHTVKHKSTIFSARFLNTPTVFITSHAGVKELLNDHHDKIELGYKAFMHHLYGDNIIFTNGSQADSLRTILTSILTSEESKQHYQDVMKRITEKHLSTLEQRSDLTWYMFNYQAMLNGQPIAVYKFFKRVATEICLCLFLDMNLHQSEELSSQITTLTTAHWHGIVSVPVNLKLGPSKSTYRKALEAKAELLTIIHSKLSDRCTLFSETNEDGEFFNAQEAAGHLLLFISALIPKALASLLTSFILATADSPDFQQSLAFDLETLQNTYHEVQRMWPPLVGGRRLAKQDFDLCGYHIPAGHAIVYLTHHAQRDPGVFTDPDVFKPDRWKNSQYDDDDLFAVGNGPRDCIGRHLVQDMVKMIMQKLSAQFAWQLENPEKHSIQYKWLPVLRPKDEAMITFKVREHQ